MNILKNKHLVIAMIVAPILAVLSYFAVDAIVSEKPHAAQPGQRYQLAEKPNCRYSSGVCGLKNGDFELTMTTDWKDNNRMLLRLQSHYPLDGAIVAMVDRASDDQPPQEMQPDGEDGLRWFLELPRPNPESSRLRLVVSSKETLYYGEAATEFSVYKTSFGEDFRGEQSE